MHQHTCRRGGRLNSTFARPGAIGAAASATTSPPRSLVRRATALRVAARRPHPPLRLLLRGRAVTPRSSPTSASGHLWGESMATRLARPRGGGGSGGWSTLAAAAWRGAAAAARRGLAKKANRNLIDGGAARSRYVTDPPLPDGVDACGVRCGARRRRRRRCRSRLWGGRANRLTRVSGCLFLPPSLLSAFFVFFLSCRAYSARPRLGRAPRFAQHRGGASGARRERQGARGGAAARADGHHVGGAERPARRVRGVDCGG